MTRHPQDQPPRSVVPDDLPADPGASFNPNQSTIAPWIREQAGAGDETLTVSGDETDPDATLARESAGDGQYATHDREAFPAVLKLRRVIGQGGFGQVWEGVQSSLGRVIAIKRLRADVISGLENDPERLMWLEKSFRHEALVAATLEHPNIVPVYDIGPDSDGMPMLAMKLVRGKPWDKVLLEDAKLPEAEFLEKHLPVLIGVSQAVAFAHNRGVVHRDIKPSQVMMGEFGEVLLMDWGLAVVFDADRVRDSPLEDTDFVTWSSFVTSPAGTPTYMAPEQTLQRAVEVGPWTDLFLLAGTLYYLLTLTPPHNAEESREAFSRAMLCEVTPPSERAEGRIVPPELEALCMRCLTAETDDRKDMSAMDFTHALQDYLTGAGKRRESIALVQRADRVLCAVRGREYTTLAEADTLVRSALDLWPRNPDAQQLREKITSRLAMAALEGRDLRLARSQAERLPEGLARDSLLTEIAFQEEEQKKAEKARRDALRRSRVDRAKAERARMQAEELIGFMLSDLFEALRPLSRIEVLDQVAQKALAYFQNHPESEDKAATRTMRARTLHYIAGVLRARTRLDEADDVCLQAQRLARELIGRGESAPAIRLLLSDILHSRAAIQFEQGHLGESLVTNDEALRLRGALHAEEKSRADLRESLAMSHHQKGSILWRMGRQDAALSSFDDAGSLLSNLLAGDRANRRLQAHLAYTINCRSWVLRAMGRTEEALIAVDRALEIRRRLKEGDPDNHEYEANYAWSLKSRGLLLEDMGKYEDALDVFRDAIAINKRLADLDPSNLSLRSELAFPWGASGRALRNLGRLQEARDAYERGVAIQRTILEKDIRHARLMRDATFNLIELAGVLLDLNEPELAERRTRQAMVLADTLLQDVPDNPTFIELASRVRLQLGCALHALGREEEAKRIWNYAADKLETILTTGDFPSYQVDTMAKLCLRLKNRRKAERWVRMLRDRAWKEPQFAQLADEARL